MQVLKNRRERGSKFSNIFLDFFNRDSRLIDGVYRRFCPEFHTNLLTEALNVAVFLCREFCIIPPGFGAECEIAMEALFRRFEYLTERLVRMPLRERTWEEFFEKKVKEYFPFQNQYIRLFDPSVQKTIEKFSISMIPRSSHVASEIITSWEEGPDKKGIWSPVIDEARASDIEWIRKIPRLINEEGVAVTWPAIADFLEVNVHINQKKLRNILQNHYFGVYIKEFRLRLVTRLPFLLSDFLLTRPDLTYDYEALKSALSPIKLWNIVRSLSTSSMTKLRERFGYWNFRDVFHQVATECRSQNELTRIFSFGTEMIKPILKETGEIDKYSNPLIVQPNFGLDLTDNEIECVVGRLESIAAEVIKLTKEEVRMGSKFQSRSKYRQKYIIGIFVALDMEREILVKRWELKGSYPEKIWTGNINSAEILVFSPGSMGRVPAAVETMLFLKKIKPDLLIVTGIAGGFEREGVQLGNVIVATSVADLAMRKLYEKGKTTIPEFRPKEFGCDMRIADFLRAANFDQRNWEKEVVDSEEWPSGKRPAIKIGPIASVDEVIRSKQWIVKLCTAWPKLLGVEMEAGGVCAAAEIFHMKVAVVRGVSDPADPTQSKEEWRIRAMKTVANLLESIDYPIIFASDKGSVE